MKKLAFFLVTLGLAATLWGCSSIATEVLPPNTQVVKGDTYLGDPVAFGYQLHELHHELYKYELEKFPICHEYSEKLTISKKPKRYGAAMFGVTALGPLSFIGATDAIVSAGISNDSVKIEAVEEYKTGRLVPCGEHSKAANEDFIIQFSESEKTVHVKTNTEGILDLSKVILDRSDDIYVNIFLNSEDYYYYITTVPLAF